MQRRRASRKAKFVLCDPSRDARACGLLQAAYENPETEHYPSGRRSSNREQLRNVATQTLEIIAGRDCTALDIGCNDGTLLSFYPRWVERFGVDSSELIDGIGPWAWTTKASFPSSEADEALGGKKFDIITAISLFEHIEDPQAALCKIKTHLADDGVFALETLYAPAILTRNCIDVLGAGVAGVYSLAVLEWIIRDAGLKIFRGALTAKNGGSIRLFITHKENASYDFEPWSERLAKLWDEENALAMRAMQPYQSFHARAEIIENAFAGLLNDIADRGEVTHLLGGDAHSLALFNWAGPSSKIIRAIVDTSRAQDGGRLGRSGPKFISETDCRAADPDYLIAPACFKRESLEHWREAIMLGAQIIFVTPAPHIVHAQNYSSEYGKTLAEGDGAGSVETLRSILAAAGGPRLVTSNENVRSA